MNWLKIQTEILKVFFKVACGIATNNIFWYENSEYMQICTDNHILYKIPLEVWVLNVKKFDIPPSEGMVKMWNRKYSESERLINLNTITSRVINGKTVYLQVFRIRDEVDIYVDTKLLKNFPVDECTFYGTGANDMVFIEWNGRLVAGVLPVKVPK